MAKDHSNQQIKLETEANSTDTLCCPLKPTCYQDHPVDDVPYRREPPLLQRLDITLLRKTSLYPDFMLDLCCVDFLDFFRFL